MQILSNILAFLFAAGIIIFVHELGHYLVAKAFGVRVLTFSLGFGSRIWGFRKGDTDYRVSFVPLGGYVSFAGQDPSEQSSDPGAFTNRPRWQRTLVLLAGPAMNLVLAWFLMAGVFMSGTEIPDQRDVPTEVGEVLRGSPAEAAGLERGDRIVALDDQEVDNWQAVAMTFLISADRPVTVRYVRDGRTSSTVLTPTLIPRYELGTAGVFAAAPARIARVLRGTPADEAGFRFGDALRSVDGRPVVAFEDFSDYVAPRAGQKLSVEVERDGEQLYIEVMPEENEGKGMIGVVIRAFHYRKLAPLEAVSASVRFSVDTSLEIFQFIGKILERRISARSALGGPIQIAAISGAAARSGFKDLLQFMALISINLFILNLMPIPVLDGGQILILLVEGTLRRDISLQIKERMTQVGLVLIVMLMAVVLYFDLTKSLPGLAPTP